MHEYARGVGAAGCSPSQEVKPGMLKNLYLAGIAAVAFGAAVLLPRLMDEGNQLSLLTALLMDPGAKQLDRLEVGDPIDGRDGSATGSRSNLGLITPNE